MGGIQQKLVSKSWWYRVAETHNLCASPMGSHTDGGAADLQEHSAAVLKARWLAGSAFFPGAPVTPLHALLPTAWHRRRFDELVLHPVLPGWARWSLAGVLQYAVAISSSTALQHRV